MQTIFLPHRQGIAQEGQLMVPLFTAQGKLFGKQNCKNTLPTVKNSLGSKTMYSKCQILEKKLIIILKSHVMNRVSTIFIL
jgi:hypothetical protein